MRSWSSVGHHRANVANFEPGVIGRPVALARAVGNIRTAAVRKDSAYRSSRLYAAPPIAPLIAGFASCAAAQLRGFETLGNFAEAKIKEAVLAVTGW